MSNPVVIKSNKHGITLVIDESSDIQTIKDAVKEKFIQSAKFFGEANMALAFEGKKLEIEEKFEIMHIIEDNCQVKILCIIDDEEKDTYFQEKLAAKENNSGSDGLFYKGTLRSGQIIEAETSVIILGDINPGAKVVSKGNVIVLGNLKGNVFAGANGNEHSFVVALDMNPMQIKIGDVIARSSDSSTINKKKKTKTIQPKIAFVENGNIYVEDLSAEVLEDIVIE